VLGSDLVVWRRVPRMDEEQPFWCTRARHLIPSIAFAVAGAAIVFVGRFTGIVAGFVVLVSVFASLAALLVGTVTVPLALLQPGYLAARPRAVSVGTSRPWPRGVWRALPLVAMFGFLGYTFYRVGWPANGGTWLIAAGLVLWSLLFTLKYSRWFWLGLAVVVVLCPAGWLSSWHTCRLTIDLSRGRFGTSYGRDRTGLGGEFELVLARPGPNTRLIESYLGPCAPYWVGWRPEPLLGVDDLERYLSLLPTRDARLRVLHCVTDPDNRLREHQKMLLIALRAFGFPPWLRPQFMVGKTRAAVLFGK